MADQPNEERPDATPPTDLELLKRLGQERGYRFTIDADGTERMYRPDGSLAVIARRRPPLKS